jgi:hypothetical protein
MIDVILLYLSVIGLIVTFVDYILFIQLTKRPKFRTNGFSWWIHFPVAAIILFYKERNQIL